MLNTRGTQHLQVILWCAPEDLEMYWENNQDQAENLSQFWDEDVNLQQCVPLRLDGDGADVLGPPALLFWYWSMPLPCALLLISKGQRLDKSAFGG